MGLTLEKDPLFTKVTLKFTLILLGVHVMSALGQPDYHVTFFFVFANSHFFGYGSLVNHHDALLLPASSRQLLQAGCRSIKTLLEMR